MSPALESAIAEWTVLCAFLAMRASEEIGRGNLKSARNYIHTLRLSRQRPPTLEQAERRAEYKDAQLYTLSAHSAPRWSGWRDDDE